MDYRKKVTMDASGFVLLSDYVPAVIQEIRYFSTYNFVGERINGYEEPCAIITKEAARALKSFPAGTSPSSPSVIIISSL